jgi:hypothetical protein
LRSSRSVRYTSKYDLENSQLTKPHTDPKRFNRHQSDRFKCERHARLQEGTPVLTMNRRRPFMAQA